MTIPSDVKTNEDFVRYLINYSKSGQLSQVFVIEAIRFYSQLIVDNGEPKDNPLSLFNPIAWYRTAKEINESWNEFYGKSNSSNLPQ